MRSAGCGFFFLDVCVFLLIANGYLYAVGYTWWSERTPDFGCGPLVFPVLRLR